MCNGKIKLWKAAAIENSSVPQGLCPEEHCEQVESAGLKRVVPQAVRPRNDPDKALMQEAPPQKNNASGSDRETVFVDDIGYDAYGQRVWIKFGNGTETSCSYDEDRRWLEKMKTTNQGGNIWQDISYSFDTAGMCWAAPIPRMWE